MNHAQRKMCRLGRGCGTSCKLVYHIYDLKVVVMLVQYGTRLWEARRGCVCWSLFISALQLVDLASKMRKKMKPNYFSSEVNKLFHLQLVDPFVDIYQLLSVSSEIETRREVTPCGAPLSPLCVRRHHLMLRGLGGHRVVFVDKCLKTAFRAACRCCFCSELRTTQACPSTSQWPPDSPSTFSCACAFPATPL